MTTSASPDLRWAQYARVSSAEQAGPDSASIEVQLRDTAQLVARDGGVLIDAYVDDKRYRDGSGRLVEPSGERADRPQWQRLIADLRSGRVNAVAAWHEWRLYRDYRPFVDFIEVARSQGTTVRLVHGLWSEQFAVFGAWMGRADNTHRRLQTMKGRVAKAERGFSMTTAPLFYKTIRDDKGRRTGYVLRPDTIDWLNRLAELFLSGMSYIRMAEELGTNPTTGRPLGHTSVQSIIANPFMRGKVEAGRRVGRVTHSIDGVQPAAWDESTCLAIEAELARRAQLGRSGPHGAQFLFSGLLRCGVCGRLMSGNRAQRRNPAKQVVVYACPLGARNRHPLPADRGRTHPANIVRESVVLEQLQALGDAFLLAGAEAVSAATAHFIVPGTELRGPDPELIERKRSALASLEAEYASTPAANANTRQWLEGQVARAQADLASLEQEAARVADPAVVTQVVAADLAAFFASGALQWPVDKLRPALLRHFPALWVNERQLCLPPQELWIAPRSHTHK